MSTVNAVTIYAENLQGANLVVGNTSSNLTVTANSIAISIGNVTVNSTAINIVSPISSTQNTTINATALTANTLKLNGTDYNGVVGDTVLVDYQVFTNPLANNVWYKPAWAQANDIITIQMWGGGGGGASGAVAGYKGGGGGACLIVNKLARECNSVCNVVVGVGGAIGSNGGNSIFYSNTTFSIISYGGGAGSTSQGGGGGGWFGVGGFGNQVGGAPLGGANGTGIPDSTFGGGGANNTVAGVSIYGGGGGAGGIGGNSVYGGGGGSNSGSSGISIFGGNGGNSSIGAQAPGGGGGANFEGARGEVRVWVTGQARRAEIIPDLEFIGKTVISSSTNGDASIVINTPDGTQAGDILLAIAVSSNRDNGHTSSDFTQWFFSGNINGSAGQNKTTVLYKILSSTPANTYSFTIDNGGGFGSTVYLALFTFRPVAFTPNTASFGTNYSRYTTYQTGTTITANSITSYANGVLFRLGTSLGPSNFTFTQSNYEVIDRTTTNNPALLLKLKQDLYTSVPDFNMTISSDSWQGASFIINTFK